LEGEMDLKNETTEKVQPIHIPSTKHTTMLESNGKETNPKLESVRAPVCT